MIENPAPKLGFAHPFDAAAAYESEARGYLAYAFVEFDDGSRCPVVFYDPVRLQQDLEVEMSEGRAFIAEPGMIVLPEITLVRMQEAVAYLYKQGYFASFRRTNESHVSAPCSRKDSAL
jgi:hypothetical protein